MDPRTVKYVVGKQECSFKNLDKKLKLLTIGVVAWASKYNGRPCSSWVTENLLEAAEETTKLFKVRIR